MLATSTSLSVQVYLLTSTTQYAQELLQTFGTSIGEVALLPVAGGTFTITMTFSANNRADADAQASPSSEGSAKVTDTVIWDRKLDGGFPETKELKNRVRNIIDPDRDLGHIDRSLKKNNTQPAQESTEVASPPQLEVNAQEKNGKDCEDCK